MPHHGVALGRGGVLRGGSGLHAALDVQGLIALADAQLYRAKRGGRTRVMAAAPDGGLAEVSSSR